MEGLASRRGSGPGYLSPPGAAPAEGTRRAADGSWRGPPGDGPPGAGRPTLIFRGPALVQERLGPRVCQPPGASGMLRVPPEKPGQGLRLQGRPWGGCQAQHKVLAAWTAGQARRLQAGLLWSLPALSDPGDPGQGRGSGIVQASAPHPPHTACSTEGFQRCCPPRPGQRVHGGPPYRLLLSPEAHLPKG